MLDYIYKIIEELERYKDTEDDMDKLNDISIINGMLTGKIMYDEAKVMSMSICSKY